MNFLILPVLELELEEFITLARVKLLSLPKVLYFDQKLLLVHLSLNIIQHGDWDVVDDFKLLVDLGKHHFLQSRGG